MSRGNKATFDLNFDLINGAKVQADSENQMLKIMREEAKQAKEETEKHVWNTGGRRVEELNRIESQKRLEESKTKGLKQ